MFFCIKRSQVLLLSCKPLMYALIYFLIYISLISPCALGYDYFIGSGYFALNRSDNGYQVLQFIAENLYFSNKRMHCWKQQCLSFIDSKVNFYLGCFNYYMKFRVLILRLPDWIKKGYALCYSVVNLQGAAILWTLINTTTLLTGSQWSQEALTWTLFLNNESKFEEISD